GQPAAAGRLRQAKRLGGRCRARQCSKGRRLRGGRGRRALSNRASGSAPEAATDRRTTAVPDDRSKMGREPAGVRRRGNTTIPVLLRCGGKRVCDVDRRGLRAGALDPGGRKAMFRITVIGFVVLVAASVTLAQ